MTVTAVEDHIQYLPSNEQSEASPQVEALRQCLLDIFEGRSDIEKIGIAGLLIEYSRDMVLPALGAIRRNAAANARTHMSVQEIRMATGLSTAVVSRLITESRGITNP